MLHEAALIGTAHANTMLKSHRRSIGSVVRDTLAHARDIVAGLIDHVRESISNALGKGQSDDSQGEQLSQSDIVDTTINDLIDELPELIAETETTGAIESTVLDTLKSGGVQQYRIVTEPDACVMCLHLADQGPVDIGSVMLPFHPRCRCQVQPVDEGE